MIELLGRMHSGMREAEMTNDQLSKMKMISQKTTVLIGELLHLSNTLLPPSQCARLQVRLFPLFCPLFLIKQTINQTTD